MSDHPVETSTSQTIALVEERARIIINDIVTGKVVVRTSTSATAHQAVVDLSKTETVIERTRQLRYKVHSTDSPVLQAYLPLYFFLLFP